MNIIREYIIVDDDPINNLLCEIMLIRTLGNVNIKPFSAPQKALDFIQNEFSKNLKSTVMFLDINMPTLSGWEFMSEYQAFSEEIKSHISIYMLSSSLDQRDKNKAQASTYIKGLISKPLEEDALLLAATI